jgi:hypothetical protein
MEEPRATLAPMLATTRETGFSGSNAFDSLYPFSSPGGHLEDSGDEFDAPTQIEDSSKVKLATKDLKAMGLAAGGKLGISHSLNIQQLEM